MADKSASHWPISLTNGAAAVLNLFLPLALVRIISPDEMGRYKMFFLYVMLSPGLFLVSGLNSGLYHWTGKYPDTKPEVRQSWSLLVATTLVITCIGYVIAPWVAPLIRISSMDLRLYLCTTPFLLISLFLEDLMIARGSIWTGAFYGAGFNVFKGISLLLAAWWYRRIEAVLWVYLLTTMIRAGIGWLMLKGSSEITMTFSWETSIKVMRYAVPVSVATLAAVALQNMDQLILSVRLTPEHFAFYAMGCLTVPPLLVLETSVNRVLIPKLSQAFGKGDLSQAARLFAESVSELFRFLLPATLGLMIYSDPIVRILFTERYLPAVPYLRLYALYYLCFALPYDAVARARADGKWILRTALLFAPLSIGVTWLGAGYWGATGALVAFLAIQVLLRLYSLAHQQRHFAAAYTVFLPFKEIRIQTALALVAGALSVLSRPLFADPRTWFWVTGPLFTVIYFGGLYVMWRQRSAQGPIHVLELAQTLGLGGLEKMVYTLARALHERSDFKVLVATYDHQKGDPSLGAQFEEAGIPLIQWQKNKGFSFRSIIRLVRIIFSKNTRVVHVHDLGPLIYGSAAKCFSLGRIRLVATVHTLLDIEMNRRYRSYYKFFLRFADKVVAVSSGVETGLLALGIEPSRIEVISNGAVFSVSPVKSRAFSEKQALRRRLMPGLAEPLYAARWILCLARLHAGKGHDVVLDVWRALPKESRDGLCLVFVGQETQIGYKEFLHQRIHDLPDQERVIIAGPSELPHEWIRSSDLFISGSRLEGMPLAPLEAAGSGLPIILSDIEGHRFLSPWAYYFNIQQPQEGAERILSIMTMMESDGDAEFFEDRWRRTASLRHRWNVPTMAASYAETFQFA